MNLPVFGRIAWFAKTAWTPITAAVFLIFIFAGFNAGCAHQPAPPISERTSSPFSSENQRAVPPPSLRRLTISLADSLVQRSEHRKVSIVVHPAYSLLVNQADKRSYPEAIRALLRRQFEAETSYITNQLRDGNMVILILPAGWMTRGDSSLSYETYLNNLSSPAASLLYLTSQTESSGTLSAEDMIALYRLLHRAELDTILVGGGYVGRCQKTFVDQLSIYVDGSKVFIIPEATTISPHDLSADEAVRLLSSLEENDVAPVRSFIKRTAGRSIRLLPVMPDGKE